MAPLVPLPPASAAPPAAPGPGWLRQRIIEGSLLLIALRWVLRGLSLIRTIVLARLLAPADFGMFSMVMLTLRMLEVPTNLELEIALVRRVDADRRLFDAAWTLRATQRLFVMIGVLLGAPLAGWYFNDPRVVSAVRVVALVEAVWALENIGIVFFRKELAFTKEIALTAVATVVGLTVTIIGAALFQNYWALIAGFIAERAIWVVATYVAHPYRPRVSWAGVRDLWRFAQWIPIQSAGAMLASSIDKFLVGHVLGATPLGIYAMAGSAGGLAVAEIVTPMTGTLLPSYARIANEPERLARGFLDALGMMAMLVIAAQVGLAAIAPTFVPVMLGPRWDAAIPAAQWLALWSCMSSLNASVSNVLIVQDRMRRLTTLTYIQLVVYAPLLLFAAQSRDLTTLAAAKAFGAVVLAPVSLGALIAVSSVTAADIVRVLWRPTVAAAVMAIAVGALQSQWMDRSVAALAAQVAVGMISFAGGVAGLWLLAGRPAGTERMLIEWLTQRVSSRSYR